MNMSNKNIENAVFNQNRRKSKCVMHCAVPMCGNKSDKNPKFVYHAFPKPNKSFVVQKNYFGNSEQIDRLVAWKNALKMNFSTAAMYVCSNHFEKQDYILPDIPSNRMRLKGNAVPSRNLPLTDPLIEEKKKISEGRLKRKLHREENAESREKCKLEVCDSMGSRFSENESSTANVTSTLNELSYTAKTLVVEVKQEEDNAKTTSSCTDISVQVTSGDFGVKYHDLIKNDSDLSTLTGIESFALLRTIIDIAQLAKSKNVNNSEKLTLEDKIVLTFMKLKQNLSYAYLAVHFQISAKHCQRIFEDTILLLSACLKHVIVWPSREEISRNSPLCFESFENVRVVLDCTEVFIQRPQNLCCQLLTHSHYKSNETCKIITGVSPAGNITFVSKIYGGRASDKAIFEHSEIIKLLEAGDAVMVDRGFLIDDICQLYNVKCIRPPFLKKQKQFSKSDAIITQQIAKARVHVERSNQRIKAFKIISETMPANLVPLLEHIFTVICAIVNLSAPILKDEDQ